MRQDKSRSADQIGPGIHPNFDISRFPVAHQRVLRRLSQLTHLNRDADIKLGRDTKYRYALIRPTGQMRGLLHTDREVMVLFSEYPEFQSRTLDAFDRILASNPDEFRIEKVARILAIVYFTSQRLFRMEWRDVNAVFSPRRYFSGRGTSRKGSRPTLAF
jgi:hypothetical protein